MALIGDALAGLQVAGRRLCKSPGFTITVVALLALGIGANTAIFSLINAVQTRMLPVPEPHRLVLFAVADSSGSSRYMIPQEIYRQIRERNSVLEDFAAATFPPITLSSDGIAERVSGMLVSGSFFETLGVDAELGRVLTPDDDRLPVSPAVCMISYGLWQRRFGEDPGVIGRRVRVNTHSFTIVGVTPKEFLGLSEDSRLDISIPLRAAGMSNYFSYPVRAFGRLKRDVSRSQAQASLDVLYRQIAPDPISGRPSEFKVGLRPGGQGFSTLRTQYEKPLLVLMGMVGIVLLIVCANVTNLLLARTSARTKEIATRLALGARRMHLAGQLLAENTVLAIGGAALGIALAYWTGNALLALAPRQIGGGELILDVSPDWRVFLFTLAVSTLVSTCCGIAPALRSARVDPGSALKGGTSLRLPRRLPFNKLLVVAQVALSLVLLVGAGLFLRSLHNLNSVDLGLNPDHLSLLTLDPGTSGMTATASNQLAERLVERARGMPGVVAASAGFISPLTGGIALTRVSLAGHAGVERPSFDVNWIGADYFRVLDTPVLAGRAFSPDDGLSNKVAIVNEQAARYLWPGESPIGKHAMIGWEAGEDHQIVGMVRDVKRKSPRGDAEAAVYLPFSQNTRAHFVLHVRVSDGTEPMIPALLREVRALAPHVPVAEATTMAAQLVRTKMLDRLMAFLTLLFGLLSVIVAAVGLYSVIAFAVVTRKREIGIRVALGASYSQVLGQVLKEGAALISLGLALGVPSALWASRFARSFLYGLSATDPATYVVLAVVLAGIGLGATWVPARQAARLDPAVALRYE
ncbi:MAG: ABC transporter permease [Bryobacterales bacterium]|nr:ABC transporter permease [Bryobacterales bacterium]